MKDSKNLFIATVSVLCCIIFALSVALGVACGGAKKGVPEVRNNGTTIQWKYSDENEWRDLVSLEELKGAAGENGKDGKDGVDGKDGIDGVDGKDGQNGVDGKDGIDGKDGQNGVDGKDGVNGADGKNGKTVEVRRTDSYIQWRYEGGEWLNLVALADLEGPAGQNGTNGVNGKTPEFRVNEGVLQWRYEGDEIWLNLYDLSSLKGLDGKDGKDGQDGVDGINGKDGKDGQDGNTPFIGENGNWWIGTTDTGVKAEGKDGAKGEKGDKGDKGDAGEKGADGKDGSSLGWYYGVSSMTQTFLFRGPVAVWFNYKLSSGDLISCNQNTVTLKKGHTYSLCISGSIELSANNDEQKIRVVMTDGYDNELCKNLTRINDIGECKKQKWFQQTFTFNRIYNAKDTEVTLKFYFEQENYNAILESFNCMLTIIALD